ncbi:uncharacterized protein METZ01_LOCUS296324, partial [marine metagenome]
HGTLVVRLLERRNDLGVGGRQSHGRSRGSRPRCGFSGGLRGPAGPAPADPFRPGDRPVGWGHRTGCRAFQRRRGTHAAGCAGCPRWAGGPPTVPAGWCVV